MSLRRLVGSGVLLLAISLGCSGGGGDPPTSPPPPGGTNHNPTVNLNINHAIVGYGQTATVTATTTDVDGNQVTLAWTAGRGSVAASGPTATKATYTAPTSWGPDSIVATASDGQGGTGRAAAQTYVRNPDPPAFTLGAVSSATCGAGSSNPSGFVLTISPAEDVLITNISIRPRQCLNTCDHISNYSPMLSVAGGTTYVWHLGLCQTQDCCQNSGCGNCGFWTVTITGQRPAPDGGSFVYECHSWSGPGDPSCN
jgi:hypothetical protein